MKIITTFWTNDYLANMYESINPTNGKYCDQAFERELIFHRKLDVTGFVKLVNNKGEIIRKENI